MSGNCSLELPYPKVIGQVTQREIEKLYDLYAGRFSEMTAITSYTYQSVITSGMPLSELLEEISVVEMRHLQMLAEVLVTFGADPIFAGAHNYFTCSYTNYCKSVREFLTTNIDGELSAREEYLALANTTQNSSLCELLTRIAMDEEMHAQLLKTAYEELFLEPPQI